jgi:WD40 repeat protein
MERLWNEERERGSHVLRRSTLTELGGAAAIVRAHLDRALGGLDAREQEAAARMFEHLVTPSGTKIAHRSSDLAEFARLRPRDVGPVIAALGRERILRPLDETDGDRYEIFHDVLADAIIDWRRARDSEREHAVSRRRQRRLAAIAALSLVALVVMTGVSVYALSQRREARGAAATARASSRDARVRAREARAGELAATALGALGDNPSKALEFALRAAKLVPSRQNEAVLRTVVGGSRLLGARDVGRTLTDLQYLPGGRTLLAAGEDGSVLLLDARTGGVVRTLAHGGAGRSATLAPLGGLAVVYGRGRARVIGVDGSSRILGPGVIAATFSTAGGTVVQTLRGGRVHVSNSRAGPRFRVFIASPGARSAVANATASRILVIGGDGRARMYDGTYGTYLFAVVHPRLTRAAFSPDGKRFATAGADGHTRIWDVRNGALRDDLSARRRNHVLALAFSPRGTFLATGLSDAMAELWNVSSGELAARATEHTNYVVGVAYSADGNSLATWSRDRTARISKANTGVALAVFSGHGDAVTALALNPLYPRAATASADGRVRIWNAQSRRSLVLLRQLPRALTGLEFVRGRLVARGERNVAYVLDPRTGRVLATRRAGPRTAAAGGVVAIVRGRAVELRRGGRSKRLPAGGVVRDVAVSRDGLRVAAAAGKKAIVWSVQTGEREHVLRLHRDIVTSVAFSSDGRRLVTAGRDHYVIEWRAADGTPLFRRLPQFGRVSDATFSPDGRWIVTAGPTTAALLDAEDGTLVFLLYGHEDQLRGAIFGPTGRRIYTAGLDGSVRAYRCDICGGLPELEAIARERMRRF